MWPAAGLRRPRYKPLAAATSTSRPRHTSLGHRRSRESLRATDHLCCCGHGLVSSRQDTPAGECTKTPCATAGRVHSRHVELSPSESPTPRFLQAAAQCSAIELSSLSRASLRFKPPADAPEPPGPLPRLLCHDPAVAVKPSSRIHLAPYQPRFEPPATISDPASSRFSLHQKRSVASPMLVLFGKKEKSRAVKKGGQT